jgi:molybdopterin molybdotransferase
LLHVKTPEEALRLIRENFGPCISDERIPLTESVGRTLAEDICAEEFVPDFNRSTVDGFAVYARDTFGSSDSMPAILQKAGEVAMGSPAPCPLQKGKCLSVPTGGEVPEGADCVVMFEHTEDYGEGMVGITKPAAPGENMIFRGDDVSPGDVLLKAGHVLTAHDLGALAALGIAAVSVRAKPTVGILSTGDELVEFAKKPRKGQIRDVNSVLLTALFTQAGAAAKSYGIIRDNAEDLNQALNTAVSQCHMVLISGGSSVGRKDATAGVIEQNGRMLFHGIAMKPGKPTILGVVEGKPVFGLPGHPVAAYLVSQLFALPLLRILTGRREKRFCIRARLCESLSSNHGRAEYVGVTLAEENGTVIAQPIHGKSGLITRLIHSDGYICIPRDCEGLKKGAEVSVWLWDR